VPVGWKARAVGFREPLVTGVSCWIALGAMMLGITIIYALCRRGARLLCCENVEEERGTGRETGLYFMLLDTFGAVDSLQLHLGED
jgi:hypothetical protein